jgi:hypothetical protein
MPDVQVESKLVVAFTSVDGPRGGKWYRRGEVVLTGECWRVGCVCDDERKFFGLAFGRQRDAEAAKAALESSGVIDEASLLEIGRTEAERIMAEAMQW